MAPSQWRFEQRVAFVLTSSAEYDVMVAIPGGRMRKRSSAGPEDETEIQLLPFLLDKGPVTNAAFRSTHLAGGHFHIGHFQTGVNVNRWFQTVREGPKVQNGS